VFVETEKKKSVLKVLASSARVISYRFFGILLDEIFQKSHIFSEGLLRNTPWKLLPQHTLGSFHRSSSFFFFDSDFLGGASQHTLGNISFRRDETLPFLDLFFSRGLAQTHLWRPCFRTHLRKHQFSQPAPLFSVINHNVG
jgi:hypothetical protein